jgi:hypothetical protein
MFRQYRILGFSCYSLYGYLLVSNKSNLVYGCIMLVILVPVNRSIKRILYSTIVHLIIISGLGLGRANKNVTELYGLMKYQHSPS